MPRGDQLILLHSHVNSLKLLTQAEAICISFCVLVVIVADKLMISQCWLKHKASLSCVGCYKDKHERVQVHVCMCL